MENKLVQLDPTGGSFSFTIVPNSTTSFTSNFRFCVMQDGSTNTATVARGSGVALWHNGTDGNITLSDGVVYTIWRESSDVWRVIAKS
jgi:hypothetical protein